MIAGRRAQTPASPSWSLDPSYLIVTILPPTFACEEMGYSQGDRLSGVTASKHEKCGGEHKRTMIRKPFSFSLNHDVLGIG